MIGEHSTKSPSPEGSTLASGITTGSSKNVKGCMGQPEPSSLSAQVMLHFFLCKFLASKINKFVNTSDGT